jgi:high-affinity nickel permease
MPKLNNGNELTELIELTQIFILSNSSLDIYFIGFYFACGWDDDHGIGFLTHKDKVVQFGQIEEASDEYFKLQ